MPDSRENHTFSADANAPVPSGKAGGADIVARLYGESVTEIPDDLYIPPEALEVFLEAFEGPLDLLLYLIRRQNFNILDIPMAQLTLQYLHYVDRIRVQKLELAAEYLLMAAMLVEIKSRLLLPKVKTETNEEPEDPRRTGPPPSRIRTHENGREIARRIAQTGKRLLPSAGSHRKKHRKSLALHLRR